jgi:hypothetical protein
MNRGKFSMTSLCRWHDPLMTMGALDFARVIIVFLRDNIGIRGIKGTRGKHIR